MARRLKTYQTSQGFFDLAIAAPSMKAALEAWGATSNLFHQGFAREADDPRIIAAAMDSPGIVLKRAVGTRGPFSEHAKLPTSIALTGYDPAPANPPAKPQKPSGKPVDEKAARKAALAYEQEERKRETARHKEEAALAKRREQRERASAKAEAELNAAEQDHTERAAKLDEERASLDKRAHAEDERWDKLRERLKAAVRKARK
jgi:hypothetical protein